MKNDDAIDLKEEQMCICEVLSSLSVTYSPACEKLINFFVMQAWSIPHSLTKILHLSSVTLTDFLSPYMEKRGRADSNLKSHAIFCICLKTLESLIDIYQISKWLSTGSVLRSVQTQNLNIFNVTAEISEKLSVLETHSVELHRADSQLRNYSTIFLSVRDTVAEWLSYSETSTLHVLSSHAALLLANSNLFTVLSVDVVCSLLASKNDRLRQRAETILSRQRRLSSELGWEIMYAFIRNWVYYRSRNSYASVALLWMFERVKINDPEHIFSIVHIECERTRYILLKESIGESFLNDNEDYKAFRSRGLGLQV